MKKNLFIIAAIALVSVSCSNEKLLNNSVNEAAVKPIGFDVYANKSTKANENNKNNLNFFYDAFKVSGWKYTDDWKVVFNNEINEYFASNAKGKYVYDAEGQKPSDEWASASASTYVPAWYYEGVRYWDKFATKYQFGAYAPKDAANVTIAYSASADDCTITMASSESKFTVESTNLMATPSKTLAYTGFTTDFMTAVAHTGNANSTSSVSLTFTHELAKFDIKLALNTEVKTNQPVIVKKIKLHNLNGSSYYDSSKETAENFLTGWNTPTGEVTTYAVDGPGDATTGYQLNLDIDPSTDGDQNYNGFYVFESLMIPQTIQKAENAAQLEAYNTNKEASIYVKYSIGNEDFEGYYALANMFTTDNSFNLAGGNEYILTITVGPAPIYFTPTVTPWAEVSQNYDVQ